MRSDTPSPTKQTAGGEPDEETLRRETVAYVSAISARMQMLGLNGHTCPAGLTLFAQRLIDIESTPTNTRPGTAARIEVYRRRAGLGLPLNVVGDYIDPEFFKRGPICFEVSPPANG